MTRISVWLSSNDRGQYEYELPSGRRDLDRGDEVSILRTLPIGQFFRNVENVLVKIECPYYTPKMTFYHLLLGGMRAGHQYIKRDEGSATPESVGGVSNDIPEQQSTSVVVTLPCPHLRKLLSSIGMSRHESRLEKDEISLPLLLSLDGAERRYALRNLPIGAQLTIEMALRSVDMSPSLLVSIDDAVKRTSLSTPSQSVHVEDDDADERQRARRCHAEKDKKHAPSALLKLFASSCDNYSLARRISTMFWAPSYSIFAFQDRDRRWIEDTTPLGVFKPGTSIRRTTIGREANVTVPRGYGIEGNCVAMCETAMWPHSGIFRWAFKLSEGSKSPRHPIVFGVTTEERNRRYRHRSLSRKSEVVPLSVHVQKTRIDVFARSKLKVSSFSNDRAREIVASLEQQISFEKDIVGIEYDTDTTSFRVFHNGNEIPMRDTLNDDVRRTTSPLRAFVEFSAHGQQVRSVCFSGTSEEYMSVLKTEMEKERECLDRLVRQIQDMGVHTSSFAIADALKKSRFDVQEATLSLNRAKASSVLHGGFSSGGFVDDASNCVMEDDYSWNNFVMEKVS